MSRKKRWGIVLLSLFPVLRVETTVRISLDTLLARKEEFYLTNLNAEPIHPESVPENLYPHGWDVSEFAVIMNWMHDDF
jgi:hypothetical protein